MPNPLSVCLLPSSGSAGQAWQAANFRTYPRSGGVNLDGVSLLPVRRQYTPAPFVIVKAHSDPSSHNNPAPVLYVTESLPSPTIRRATARWINAGAGTQQAGGASRRAYRGEGQEPTLASNSQSLAEALATPASNTGYQRAYDRGPFGENRWNADPPGGRDKHSG